MMLKACPFCGGVAHLDFSPDSNKAYWQTNGFETDTPTLYRVFCGSCKCQTGRAEDTITAIKLWNRRPEGGDDG